MDKQALAYHRHMRRVAREAKAMSESAEFDLYDEQYQRLKAREQEESAKPLPAALHPMLCSRA